LKTKIKVIVDLPDYAERAALSGAKGVGLVRLEGIIALSGKHPLYYVKNEKMDEYVRVLEYGLKKIVDKFDEVWIRSSDLRSDEFSHLDGAPQEKESNPMLGDHGIRFSVKHREILKAEIEAVKRLAEKNPSKKLGFMIPQVISVDDVKQTKQIAEEIGAKGKIKIGIMVETPAAVQIINDLCEEGLDFISFGTNDLTQYTLAIDRNNAGVQALYNEMNPAVLNSIRYVIRRCKKYGVETSVCGQAASKPEMAEFLVSEGIDSLSVNADAAFTVSETVAKIEAKFSGINDKDKKVERENNYVTRMNNVSDSSRFGDNVNYNNDNRGDNRKEERITSKDNNYAKIEVTPMMASQLSNVGNVNDEYVEIKTDIKEGLTTEENKDIEEVLLEELEKEGTGNNLVKESENVNNETKMESEIKSELDNKVYSHEDEYTPSTGENRHDRDIPPLNDAIPIDSDLIEEASKKEENEGDLGPENEVKL
ncbi:hypothetical protein HYT52_01665, partial [Candidatus Woesearchaeota archaeon]|nr:hypothetical protein [Candidatus Woesearchaeota archaeon]